MRKRELRSNEQWPFSLPNMTLPSSFGKHLITINPPQKKTLFFFFSFPTFPLLFSWSSSQTAWSGAWQSAMPPSFHSAGPRQPAMKLTIGAVGPPLLVRWTGHSGCAVRKGMADGGCDILHAGSMHNPSVRLIGFE